MQVKFKRFPLRYLPEITILGLLLALYIPVLLHWYDGWLHKNISTEHEYFSHGLIGLPFAAYLGWGRRDRWQRLPNQTHFSGFILLLIGIALYLSNLTDLVNLSLPIVLAGLCVWFKGLPGFRLQIFPLALVLLAAPNEIPYLVAPYTLPLQKFIAGMAGFILVQFGMEVRVEQIYLFVNDQIVEVAPYCAGLKMVFTSLYVGLMLLQWTGTQISRDRLLLFFSGIITLSVAANIIRNTLLSFFHGTGQQQAFEWLHDGWGGDLYSTCLLILLIPLLRGVERITGNDQLDEFEDLEDLEVDQA
ncbi:MAG: cyanoexosortase B [Timaviella obliquedivisa GSE-PSE-MK23-08B]|nr:cyanoexosortase B [Timaviella obliquedivisa GSE-PSE-MK23-08B]